MANYVQIGNVRCGPDYPPLLVAELGINHNGSLDDAVQMVRQARMSGVQMVKFQKRTPRICIPESEWYKKRDTPWGERDYIDYKEDIEFGALEYDTIHRICKEEGLLWFASVWDEESVNFMETYDPPCYKIGSASLTDYPLLERVLATERPIIVSTGMSTPAEIDTAVTHLCHRAKDRLIVCHSTSIYPCPLDKLNMKFVKTLTEWFPDLVIGYSGHERASRITQAAVSLGASYIERHFTLDRRGWGTDQAASIEQWQFKDMADRIMETWISLGTGVKEVYPEEEEKKQSLRRSVHAVEQGVLSKDR